MTKTNTLCRNRQQEKITLSKDTGGEAIENHSTSFPKQGGDVEGAQTSVPSVPASLFLNNTCFGTQRVFPPKAESTHYKYNVGCFLIGKDSLSLQPQGIEPVLKSSHKCVVTLDHFTVQLSLKPSFIFSGLSKYGDVVSDGNFHFELRGSFTGYRKGIVVYWHGEEYGILSTEPTNPNVTVSLFQLTNIQFYTQGYINRFFDEFLPEMEAQFVKVSKVDIALDGGYGSAPHLTYKLISKANDKRSTLKVYNGGNLKISPYYQGLKEDAVQWSVGSRSSDKRIKVYNKSKELHQKQHKSYISDYWKQNGIVYSDSSVLNKVLHGEIYRLEMTLKAKEIDTIEGFDVMRMNDPEYLLSLLKYEVLGDGDSAQPFLKFYREGVGAKGGKVRNSPPKINPLMRLQSAHTELSRKPKKLSDGTYKAKMAISSLIELIEITYGSPEDVETYSHSIFNLLEKHDLHRWYAERYPKMAETIALKNRLKVAS